MTHKSKMKKLKILIQQSVQQKSVCLGQRCYPEWGPKRNNWIVWLYVCAYLAAFNPKCQTDPLHVPSKIILKFKMANKWTPNSDCFSAAFLISYMEDCDTNTAGSLLIKLLVLVLPVGNNKALKPGRAEEPQVSCSLSRQNGFASLFPKALTFRGSCLLPHLGGSWVIMEGDYWVLVGRRRHQLIISETKSSACWGGWLDCYLNTIILRSKKSFCKTVK